MRYNKKDIENGFKLWIKESKLDNKTDEKESNAKDLTKFLIAKIKEFKNL